MPIRKKKEFELLKAGEFFRHKRKLYLKNAWNYAAIRISNGQDENFNSRDLVIPVKVKITVK